MLFPIDDYALSPDGTGAVIVLRDAAARALRFDDGRSRRLGRLHWDTGGHRVGLSGQRDCVISARYQSAEVRCVDIRDGSLRWSQPVARGAQRIVVDDVNDRCFVLYESAPFCVLNLDNGTLISRGTRARVLAPWSANATIHAVGRSLQCTNGDSVAWRLQLPRPAMHVYFAHGYALVATMGGPLVAVELVSGKVAWTHAEKGAHYQDIAALDLRIFAIRFHYSGGAGVAIDEFTLDGMKSGERQLGDIGLGVNFALGGACVCLIGGVLLDTRTGAARLHFSW